MAGFRLLDQRRAPLRKDTPEEIICDERQLLDVLQQIMIRNYGFFIFFSPENNSLSVAVRGEYGYVEFADKASSPPYLYAVRPAKTEVNVQGSPSPQLSLFPDSTQGRNTGAKTKQVQTSKMIEFNIGGTPTRMPVARCVSIQDVIDIVQHYFRYQELSPAFEWKEI